MGFVLLLFLGQLLLLAGLLAWHYLGPASLVFPAALAVAVCWWLWPAIKTSGWRSQQAPEAPVSDDEVFVRELIYQKGVVVPIGEEPPQTVIERLQERLAEVRNELYDLRRNADLALEGPAVARLQGRVASIEPSTTESRTGVVWLAVPDEDDDWQAVKVRVEAEALQDLPEGASTTLVCRWIHGRLTVASIESVEETDEPMPEVRIPEKPLAGIPDWFRNATNERRKLLKASEGSSSVSDLRVHLVWATKRRGRVLTGPMVERLKTLTAEVVEAKGLGQLLAVNGEEDHVHVALWLPVTISGSDALGAIKAFTSGHLRREFPELHEHNAVALWQRGGYVGAIGSGGDLSTVLAYIEHQRTPATVQEAQEGAFDEIDGQDDLPNEVDLPGAWLARTEDEDELSIR